jgi:hypothetical protein
MSNDSNLPPEIALGRSLEKWFAETQNLIAAYRQSGLPVPKLLDGVVKPAEGQVARSMVVLPPARPDAPSGVTDSWIWLDKKDASPQSLVLAFLKEAKTLGAKELIAKVRAIHKDINPGVLYNVGARLQGKKIKKSGKNWEIIEGQEVPILYKDHIWAPAKLLSVQEQAAFRRMSVRHLMRGSPEGIKSLDIFKTLDGVDWLKPVSVSKDLIQDDLEAGDGDWCRQMGVSKKWKLISEDDKK